MAVERRTAPLSMSLLSSIHNRTTDRAPRGWGVFEWYLSCNLSEVVLQTLCDTQREQRKRGHGSDPEPALQASLVATRLAIALVIAH